jgi:hypothetical protein
MRTEDALLVSYSSINGLRGEGSPWVKETPFRTVKLKPSEDSASCTRKSPFLRGWWIQSSHPSGYCGLHLACRFAEYTIPRCDHDKDTVRGRGPTGRRHCMYLVVIRDLSARQSQACGVWVVGVRCDRFLGTGSEFGMAASAVPYRDMLIWRVGPI